MTDDQGQQTVETPTEAMPTSEEPVNTPVETDSAREERVEKHNKEYIEKLQSQLQREREARVRDQQALQALKNPPIAEKEFKLPPLVDPNTGLLDEKALAERDRLLMESQQRAERLERTVQDSQKSQAQRDADQENNEMYQEFPELVPDSKDFSKELHALTRAIYLDAMTNPGDYGKQLRGVEAAQRAKAILMKNTDQAKQQGAQEALEKLSPKEQAALEATGSSGRRTQVNNIDELRRQTRRGNADAISARLNALKS